WTGVQCDDFVALDLECQGEHRSLRAGPGIAVVHRVDDPRVLEHGGIELRRFLSVAVEPQTCAEFFHRLLPSLCFSSGGFLEVTELRIERALERGPRSAAFDV